MDLRIMCGNVFVNEHSDGGQFRGFDNPFGDFIPLVGDILELGGKHFGRDSDCEGEKYVVLSREFKAYETFNRKYDNASCTIYVKKINQDSLISSSKF